MRIALGVEYEGSSYYGWQAQKEVLAIQACLEQALGKVADHAINVQAAGRTDKGVHALCQVVHFDTEVARPLHAWVKGGNRYLPNDIRVLWAKMVPEDFHARFSALARSYRYIIYNHGIRPSLLRNYVGWYPMPLEEKLMAEGGRYLIGEHDFSAFRGSDCQAKSPMRKVEKIKIMRFQDYIIIDITANAFLHHMVRNIVGALVLVGKGEREPSWIKKLLLEKDPSQAGVIAGAAGLYLAEISYPHHFDLPHTVTKSFMPLIFP